MDSPWWASTVSPAQHFLLCRAGGRGAWSRARQSPSPANTGRLRGTGQEGERGRGQLAEIMGTCREWAGKPHHQVTIYHVC